MSLHLLRSSAAVSAAVFVATTLCAAPADAAIAPLGAVTEVTTGITANSEPYDIVSGPDGNLWFTEPRANKVARMTPRGIVTELSSQIPADVGPLHLTVGPDGNLWFSEAYKNQLARLTTGGAVTEFAAGPASGRISDVATGPDGNLWYVKRRAVGRMTPTGDVTEFTAGISSDAVLGGIAAGPDGNLWFSDYYDRIGRITPTGEITVFTAGITPGSFPDDITAGPEGNLWFTESDGRRIGRITTSGVVTEFTGPTSSPIHIATGPDGNLWFTRAGDGIGRITPDGVVTEFSAGISEGAGPFGITAGPDGNVWFTEMQGDSVGRIGTAARLTMTCVEKGGVTQARLKVVCRIAGLGPSPSVRWRVARKDTGAVVAHGRKALVDGKLAMNLTHADVRKGRHRVTVTRGSGIDKVVVTRVLRLT